MKILFFGDIVGQPGREAIAKILPKWKKKYQPDIIIANGENMAHGHGVAEKSLKEVLKSGIDLITSGDHIWDQKQATALLEDKDIPLLRPANYPKGVPGKGYKIIKLRTKRILVINLIGRVFMKEQFENPFLMADEIIEQESEGIDAIVVDWHAEATSEKVCLGWYLDGRTTAVLGTHTHIPTADARILPKGTAYISDIGMVGVKDSSLGMDKEAAIKRFLTQIPYRLEMGKGPVEVNAVLVETGKNKKAKKISQLKEIVAS